MLTAHGGGSSRFLCTLCVRGLCEQRWRPDSFFPTVDFITTATSFLYHSELIGTRDTPAINPFLRSIMLIKEQP
jgi:hypothetical protein